MCAKTLDSYVVAEEVGFEPTDGLHRQTISSRSRYDHFDTPPYTIKMLRQKQVLIKALERTLNLSVISEKTFLRCQNTHLP